MICLCDARIRYDELCLSGKKSENQKKGKIKNGGNDGFGLVFLLYNCMKKDKKTGLYDIFLFVFSFPVDIIKLRYLATAAFWRFCCDRNG